MRALSGFLFGFFGRGFFMKFRAICENHLYSKAYSKGKRAVTSALAVYVLPDYMAKRLAKSHPDKKVVNRIGLTATKALGGAVIRSRVRRILREGLRQLVKEKPIKCGYLIVIAARRASTDMKSTEIRRHLEDAFTKLGMYEAQ
jgi:ribonuclease P protein component